MAIYLMKICTLFKSVSFYSYIWMSSSITEFDKGSSLLQAWVVKLDNLGVRASSLHFAKSRTLSITIYRDVGKTLIMLKQMFYFIHLATGQGFFMSSCQIGSCDGNYW